LNLNDRIVHLWCDYTHVSLLFTKWPTVIHCGSQSHTLDVQAAMGEAGLVEATFGWA
jgi:hypothetical protein